MLPDPGEHPEELWGIEDPRITFLPELEQYAVTHTAHGRAGPGVALALTEGFRSFRRMGLIQLPDNKDAALLPRRIDGRFALLHRPIVMDGAHIWLSLSPDLRHWGEPRLVLRARRGGWWDAGKIGLGPPPMETPRGWLMIHHGVRQVTFPCGATVGPDGDSLNLYYGAADTSIALATASTKFC